ncbi:class I SAM-dependent methyltransferase [Hydrogenophaga sp. OTU3427]|uniref:class I SAM-dependent methyltransferase n=1 Tax=Hydrogenophaga sp. OTU3427 TaxID=3043856 RepID=UPI00313EE45A
MQALLDTIAALQQPTDCARVFHGRGGLFAGHEHWTLDAYPPVWVLTSFQPVADAEVAQVQQALATRWAQIAPDEALNLVFQTRVEGRSDTQLLAGSVPEPHVVTEGGARFAVHVLRGQNHGLFLDMAEGRTWVRQHAAGQKVLNLFAYTCAFSVAALQGGARHVLNIDMAAGAIATGQHNHALNGLKERASFMSHDIFKTWGKITRAGAYGLVIVDPPSYQRGSFVAGKDYPRLLRRLPELVAPGGHALLCLNAPELGSAFLQDQMRENAPELVFEQRLANPPAFADIDPERALKVLVYRAPELAPPIPG